MNIYEDFAALRSRHYDLLHQVQNKRSVYSLMEQIRQLFRDLQASASKEPDNKDYAQRLRPYIQYWERYLADMSLLYPMSAQDSLSILHDFEVTPPLNQAPVLPKEHQIGREAFLRDLKPQLFQKGCIALFGVPGIGKTTLAVKLAHDPEVLQHYSDGVLWANVGVRPNAHRVLREWGAALGISEAEIRQFATLQERKKLIEKRLANRRMLLVADDVWDLEVGLDLNVAGPGCGFVVTTYTIAVAMGLAKGESAAVPGLTENEGLDYLTQNSLDIDRQSDAEASFRRLVKAVQGSPIALSLVAPCLVKLHTASPDESLTNIAEELLKKHTAAEEQICRSSFARVLQARLPEVWPGRSIETAFSLLAAIHICLELTDLELTRILLDLSVFSPMPHSFDANAAQAVASASIKELDKLVRLGFLESSTVPYTQGDMQSVQHRYMIHKSISDYLVGQRIDSMPDNQEESNRETRFVKYYVHNYEQSALPHAADGISADETNILVALETAARLCLWEDLIKGIETFGEALLQRGLYAQSRHIMKRLPTAAMEVEDKPLAAMVLIHLGSLENKLGNHEIAMQYLEQALNLAKSLENHALMCRALQGLGSITLAKNQYVLARQILLQALEIAKSEPDERMTANLCLRLGWVESNQGRDDEAEAYSKEGLTIANNLPQKDPVLTAGLLLNLGIIQFYKGDYRRALEIYLDALNVVDLVEAPEIKAAIFQALGGVQTKRGEYPIALGDLQQAMNYATGVSHRWYTGLIWKEMGELFLTQLINTMPSEAIDLEALASEAFQNCLHTAASYNEDLIGFAWYGLARVAASQGNFSDARLKGRTSFTILKTINHRIASEVELWLETIELKNLGERKHDPMYNSSSYIA